ncbi:DUF3137 domain-containing protein [Mycoplasmopsis gallinarum]
MRVVHEPLTKHQFLDKYKEKTKEIVSNAFDEATKTINIKKSKIFYWIGVGLIPLGIILIILAAYMAIITNSNGTLLNVLAIISVILGFITLITGIIFVIITIKKTRKVNASIIAKLKNDRLFAKTFEAFNYELFDTEAETIKYLATKYDENESYKFENALTVIRKINQGDISKNLLGIEGIPIDAQIISNYNNQFVVDEYNNIWKTFNLTFYWVRQTTDHKGNIVTHEYRKNLFAVLGYYPNNDRAEGFKFAIGHRPLSIASLKANVKLENNKFNKKFNLYSNDELKIRNVFTPLTMEKYIELASENVNVPGFGLYYDSPLVLSWFAGSEILEFNWPKVVLLNKHKIVNFIVNDVLNDSYLVYWVSSFMNVPPYFY